MSAKGTYYGLDVAEILVPRAIWWLEAISKAERENGISCLVAMILWKKENASEKAEGKANVFFFFPFSDDLARFHPNPTLTPRHFPRFFYLTKVKTSRPNNK